MSSNSNLPTFNQPRVIVYRFLDVIVTEGRLKHDFMNMASQNLQPFLEEFYAQPELTELVDQLREQSYDERDRNPNLRVFPVVFGRSETPAAVIGSLCFYINWRMKRDSQKADLGKSNEPDHKLIKWVVAYAMACGKGTFTVHDRFAEAIKKRHADGIKQYVYSRLGECWPDINRQLLAFTSAGDLTPYINGYFSPGAYPPTQVGSYKTILRQISTELNSQIEPNQVMLFTTRFEECAAAAEAGLVAIKVKRPGDDKIRIYPRVKDMSVLQFTDAPAVPVTPSSPDDDDDEFDLDALFSAKKKKKPSGGKSVSGGSGSKGSSQAGSISGSSGGKSMAGSTSSASGHGSSVSGSSGGKSIAGSTSSASGHGSSVSGSSGAKSSSSKSSKGSSHASSNNGTSSSGGSSISGSSGGSKRMAGSSSAAKSSTSGSASVHGSSVSGSSGGKSSAGSSVSAANSSLSGGLASKGSSQAASISGASSSGGSSISGTSSAASTSINGRSGKTKVKSKRSKGGEKSIGGQSGGGGSSVSGSSASTSTSINGGSGGKSASAHGSSMSGTTSTGGGSSVSASSKTDSSVLASMKSGGSVMANTMPSEPKNTGPVTVAIKSNKAGGGGRFKSGTKSQEFSKTTK